MGRSRAVTRYSMDPVKSAETIGLRYARAGGPGISRVRAGKGFRYIRADQRPVQDADDLRRIRALVIPPAWTEVWISPSATAHLQAVGRDAKGRKQYRYHAAYRQVRDETKFGRMLAFGSALPRIRERVDADLRLPGLPKEKVLATVVKLLDQTCMRIGNDEYAKKNCSYGLTTLKDKHVIINGSRLEFRFRGKSGQEQDISLTDRRLARIVKQCRDVPGYELFQYTDETGGKARIDSADVNGYLREISGADFTAKDFRTWGGTGLAASAFEKIGDHENETEAKRNVVSAIKTVAQRLGNRPATCRKYYVHPAVIEAYMERSLLGILKSLRCERREEACVMQLVGSYIDRLACAEKDAKDLRGLLRRSLRTGNF